MTLPYRRETLLLDGLVDGGVRDAEGIRRLRHAHQGAFGAPLKIPAPLAEAGGYLHVLSRRGHVGFAHRHPIPILTTSSARR
jgi:hypothetical protein